MNRKPEAIVVALLMASAAVWAQQPPGGGMAPGAGPNNPPAPRQGDPMAENFFPPELVMQNQQAIGLKEDQQVAIKTEMQKMMTRFTDLQWQQSAENEAIASLVKQERPDEKQVLAHLDKLLSIESEIKRMHLTMLIRIKNTLTSEQQARLREMKPKGPPPGMGPQGRGQPPSPREASPPPPEH